MRFHILLGFLIILTACEGCQGVRHRLLDWVDPQYPAPAEPLGMQAVYDGADADRAPLPVTLSVLVEGLAEPTDLQFSPVNPRELWILEKQGRIVLANLDAREQRALTTIGVISAVEQGLLGLAFHPNYADNGRLYLNFTTRSTEGDVSRVQAFVVDDPTQPRRLDAGTILLDLPQPYQNHNAGVLLFGPDGMLYIPWGDGGWRGDPHDDGQNPQTWLGSILRIDVDRTGPDERPWSVPPDNPFAGGGEALPEIWAWGLRNPWRASFTPDGRMVVADVGQNAWEEIDLIRPGGNYGWRFREGRACYTPSRDCPREGLIDPVYVYGHDEGRSITGGHVYTGSRIPDLRNRYVFGDFVTGRLWAIDLPEPGIWETDENVPVRALGRWPILPSTFGIDADGEIYLADFGRGRVLRIDPVETAARESR